MTFSMGSPMIMMVVTLSQQYNVGERSTIIIIIVETLTVGGNITGTDKNSSWNSNGSPMLK